MTVRATMHKMARRGGVINNQCATKSLVFGKVVCNLLISHACEVHFEVNIIIRFSFFQNPDLSHWGQVIDSSCTDTLQWIPSFNQCTSLFLFLRLSLGLYFIVKLFCTVYGEMSTILM